jgi:hypothetical protein
LLRVQGLILDTKNPFTPVAAISAPLLPKKYQASILFRLASFATNGGLRRAKRILADGIGRN